MNESLARLANRVAIDPYFLAFALAEYAATEGLDDAGLAAALGVAVDRLPHLRLCPTPRVEADGFREDVERIAAKFGVNRATLIAAARHGQVVAAMRAAATDPAETGFMIAARDRPKS